MAVPAAPEPVPAARPPTGVPQEAIKTKLLVVEGPGDCAVFSALLQHLNLQDAIQLQVFGGVPRLRDFLIALWKTTRFEEAVVSVGIVRDADTSPNDAFRSVVFALQNAGVAAPAQPMATAPGPPAITVMIVPDGQSSGSIETLCPRSVAGDTAIPCVDRYLRCLKRQGLRLPSSDDKRRMQAFFASPPGATTAHAPGV